jgi:hypothetical protein
MAIDAEASKFDVGCRGGDIRRDFGLGAQMTVRAIAKVVEVYKRGGTLSVARI